MPATAAADHPRYQVLVFTKGVAPEHTSATAEALSAILNRWMRRPT